MLNRVRLRLRELKLHRVNTGDSYCGSPLISQRRYTPNEAVENGKLKNKSDFSAAFQADLWDGEDFGF